MPDFYERNDFEILSANHPKNAEILRNLVAEMEPNGDMHVIMVYTEKHAYTLSGWYVLTKSKSTDESDILEELDFEKAEDVFDDNFELTNLASFLSVIHCIFYVPLRKCIFVNSLYYVHIRLYYVHRYCVHSFMLLRRYHG